MLLKYSKILSTVVSAEHFSYLLSPNLGRSIGLKESTLTVTFELKSNEGIDFLNNFDMDKGKFETN